MRRPDRCRALRLRRPRPGAPSRAGARLPGSPQVARARLGAALAGDDPLQASSAARGLSELGLQLLAAEAEYVAAQRWRRGGNPRRATAAAQRSAAAARLCEGARTPILSTPPGAAELTRRELEISHLAALGHPAGAIAEQLFLSVRTVNNHLQRIYRKLGINSRGELADYLGTRHVD